MAQGNVATPFLDLRSFVREETDVFASEAPSPALASPFVSVYEMEGRPELVDPEQEAGATLAQELYDEEFDEALFELMVSARALHEEHLVSGTPGVDSERLLVQHFAPLVREAEAAVDAFGRAFGSREVSGLSDGELDAFAESYAPAASVGPEFEEFLGKFAKKLAKGVKGIARKAGQLALNATLGPALAQVKALAGPLLERVLKTAVERLPESLRPAARQLAERIAGRRPAAGRAADSAGSTAPPDATAAADATAASPPAGAGATEIQQEFDRQLAHLLTASDQVEMELEVAQVRSVARQPAVPVYADLDRARERFVDELSGLREGEDPGPHIQNFLPAVLPALRLGIRLIGRGRVVGFLSGFLAKMIGKLVGPATAPALSRAIVDAGLKLLALEVAPQDEARAAASAVAATVEETVRRVAALPDYVLDDQELLEGFALAAFEQAAAGNLPAVLPDAVYRERPDLRESYAPACWVMLPLRRRKRYKKCARVFKVRIGPYLADEIESFEGPLSDHLQDQLGVEEGAEVEAEVHLYETLPDTLLSDIARAESEAPAAGTSAASAAQLHPLTPQAAGLLLGEPRMGRVAPWGTHRRRVGVGQRFYRLAIPGRRLMTAAGGNGRPRPRRLGGLRVTLDVPRKEVRLCLFLSEVKAQRLAVRLRRQSHPGAIAAGFSAWVGRRLAPVLRGERPTHVQVVHPGVAQGDALGAVLRGLPADATAALAAKLQEHVVGAFGELVKGQAQRIVAAAEDTADGITIRFTVAQPAGLDLVGQALVPGGTAAGLAEAIRGGAKAEVRVDVAPGYRCD